MATIRLDRIDSLLKQINADAETTARTFQHIAGIVNNIQTAQLAKMPDLLRASANEAMRLDRAMQGAISRQRAALPGAMGRQIQTLRVPTAPTDAEIVDKARLDAIAARTKEFERVFQVQGKSAQEAAGFLRKYGFELENIKRVMIDPITGTRTFTAEMRQADGIIRRASFAFDRFGNVVGDSGTRFKGFTDMISRNIVKVLEWAVAVGVVYGALAKIHQLIDDLRDFDEIMSDIAITSQESGEALNKFFESAVTMSRQSGLAMREVLGVYDEALKATTSISDETARMAAVNQVMTGALQLSRLTGMDTAEAMDTLVGALKQLAAGMEDVSSTERAIKTFEQATHVLDIWAFTALNSGVVSMDDLATTFAITGAAASAAGVDIEELTALTAVLAETTQKSADEIGNSIRRMLITMQSETGLKALEELGISLEDLSGNMRDWDEIMEEIARRRRAGAISDEAYRGLTYALGGGPRGAADIDAVISSFDQVLSRTDQLKNSTDVAGSAQRAMAEKSKTLNNAINELSTAFANLTMSLGADGGLMDLIIGFVELTTNLVDGINGIVEILGPATTRILLFATALGVLTKYGPYLKEMFGRTGFGMGLAAGLGRPQIGAGMGQMVLPGFEQAAPKPTLAQRAGAFAPALIYAGAVAMGEGDTKEKAIRAGSVLAGAAISTMLTGSPLIGALIGDVAGQNIVNAIEGIRLATTDVTKLSTEELEQLGVTAKAGLERAAYGTLRKLFMPREQIDEQIDELIRIYRERGAEAAEEFYKSFATIGPLFDPVTGAKGFDVILQQLDKIAEAEEELGERGMASDEGLARVQLIATERDKGIHALLVQIEQEKIINDLIARRQEALVQLSKGEINKKAFNDLAAAIDSVTQSGVVALEAFEDFYDIDADAFFIRWIEMAPEARDEIMSIVTRINQLEDAIARTNDEAEKAVWRKELKAAEEQAKVFFELPTPFEEVEAFQFKGFVDVDASEAEFEELLARAVELMESYADQLGLDPEDILGATEDWVAHFEDIFKNISEVPQQFFKLAQQEADDLKKSLEDAFNLQRLRDLSPSQIPELEQRVNYWRTFLSRIPGYEAQAEDQPFNLVIGEENVFHQLITTQEALRFAIQDLTEVEKKQLEGMWNIPAGATVMVPLQSLYYAPKGAGAGGVPNLPPFAGGAGAGLEGVGAEFDQPADKMDMAGDKMLTAAERMEQFPMTLLPTIPAEPIEMTYDPQLEMQRMAREQMRAAEEALYVMWQQGIEKLPEGGFGPEPAGPSMWEQAITEWAGGGFGPALEPMVEAQVDGRQLAMDMSANFKPELQVEVPPIDANIVLNVPPITLNGTAVSKALRIEQTRRLDTAARTRGVAGGGVIQ